MSLVGIGSGIMNTQLFCIGVRGVGGEYVGAAHVSVPGGGDKTGGCCVGVAGDVFESGSTTSGCVAVDAC